MVMISLCATSCSSETARRTSFFQRPSRFDGDKGIIANDVHPQRKRIVCHHSANGTQADYAQCFALDFRAYKAFFSASMVFVTPSWPFSVCAQAVASNTLREAIIALAKTNSFTALALAPGVLKQLRRFLCSGQWGCCYTRHLRVQCRAGSY